jgi:hypothetical protein
MKIVRIERNEDEIQKLEDDLIAFEALVSQYEATLTTCLTSSPASPPSPAPPWRDEPAAPPPASSKPLPAPVSDLADADF